MEQIFSQRLKNARIMQGFSMDELCEATDNIISKQAISKYEHGKMLPNSIVLIQLANALKVNVDYFFKPFQIKLEGIEFRKKTKLSSKGIAQIKEQVLDSIERYLEIEDILSINSDFTNCLDNIVVRNRNDIKPLVDRIRNLWKIGEDPIVSIIELLEENKIKVIEIDAPDSFDGLSGFVGKKCPFIILNKNFSSERKRLTAMHELAHLLLNIDPVISPKEKEHICNQFANEILISESVFIHLIGCNRKDIALKELIDIQCQYGISIDALMYKAKELNVITESRFKTYFIKKNRVADFKKIAEKSRFKEECSSRFERLVYRALASEIISFSKASVLIRLPVHQLKDSLNLV
ncbi:helix-turn-helix domain-containing protein [Odoribacter lunatus]|uniref:helix-turn-helix domain-containing protein n=1 Tax=Odoribacter lunatus TaxID=2941335 RepID=UPI0020416981|nr:XRE family transcriptional regulator [Odoribacter lunatus]